MEFESLQEALTFAAAKEQMAARFYSELAQRVDDPVTQGLMEDLAAEEVEHRSRIELELMKLGHVVGSTDAEQTPRVTGIEVLDEIPTDLAPIEGVRLAIRKEQASFRLYVELLACTADPGIREALLALAEEEIRHKLRFEKVYEVLQAGE